jgi:Concanavalin A-like lectin/glucanases superfamily
MTAVVTGWKRKFGLVGMALVLVGAMAGMAEASTPAGLWHMDELSGGVMVDATANNNNGTLVGAVAPGQADAWSGTSYKYPGGLAYVDVPDSPSLDPGTAPITLTAHVNLTVPPAAQKDYDLIRKGLGSSGQDYKIEIKTVNGKPQVLCLFQGTTAEVMKKSGSGTPPLANGVWHTLQCVKTDTYVQVFIDGVSYGKNKKAVGSISNSDDLLVGARSTAGDDQYVGLMDEVEVDIGA